jgi:hypothetical protein
MPMSNKRGIDRILAINQDNSKVFAAQHLERRRYRSIHPTRIAFIKCMDGRIHGPTITKTPLGLIRPYRNIGGRFDMGWDGFQKDFNTWVDFSISKGNYVLVLITYHYSKGDDKHRGCGGFGHDGEAARRSAIQFKREFDEVYTYGGPVSAIVCGVETDSDTMVLHGENDQLCNLLDTGILTESEALDTVKKLFPSLPDQVKIDLSPLVSGNSRHTSEIVASDRPICDAEHQEWVLGIGTGYDWLHIPNQAFITGFYDPRIEQVIEKAATFLLNNARKLPAPPNDFVLMISAPFLCDKGPLRKLAHAKAKFVRELTLEVIRSKVPDLIPYLQLLVGVVNQDNMVFETIDRRDHISA